MSAVIGWILVLAPFLKELLTKLIPKIISRFRGIGRKLTGNAEGLGGGGMFVGMSLSQVLNKNGVIGAIFFILVKVWEWLKGFPGFLKGFFEVGGALYFLRPLLEFMIGLAKTPILLALSLVVSSLFPTILEKIFLIVGSVTLRIVLFFFKIGKKAFLGAVNNGGDGIVDEFRDSILGSFDELPDCMIQVMGYMHLVEDLGLIITTASLLAIVSAFRVVYGSFGGVKPLGYFS